MAKELDCFENWPFVVPDLDKACEKIEKLVADGLVILGPAPEKSPSLQGYPECDAKVKAIAARMWRDNVDPFSRSVKYGKGRVYKDASLEQVFADMGIAADFTSDDPELPLQFIHLRL